MDTILRTADISIDWNEHELVRTQPEDRGFRMSVSPSDIPGPDWSRQFTANAMSERQGPSDRRWLSQPRLSGDAFVIDGVAGVEGVRCTFGRNIATVFSTCTVPDATAVEMLRAHLYELVQLTNEQAAQD
jgi:hypothetical protein